ncbi:urease accessory protein UreF [Halalkalicoccus jeotgali]|uniref:Urease accessory protein F UreF n=1 Tax=Halalkalicoccus jeotgali (strain DSM 18796 / CECT 7217 / JCM 14584 / KCTC 4019 / B3) TaxID=795797 RepID=D8J7E0_HALJB|nr:urease accessory UreF family protein [Halalkalicoccus jeotgali]ADJ14035.1 urease accessory protein F UreF [Halalkalicoccus jeotgali B3]ELY33921.1 urease accessory protein F UreF [Halalkalicoccus jeotgali B3]
MGGTDDGGLLSALRLADSFLPVGSYTLSYGLETFVEEDRVADADDLRGLLADYLRGQVGPCDMVALSVAHRAAREGDRERLARIDDRLHATLLAREFRESSLTSGKRLLDVVAGERAFVDEYAAQVGDSVRGHFPTALGVVTARKGLSEREARLVCGYAFVTGLLGAAQRLLRLGHSEVQRVLHGLFPVIEDVEREAAGRGLEALRSCTPLIDVQGMCHERADRRLFVS